MFVDSVIVKCFTDTATFWRCFYTTFPHRVISAGFVVDNKTICSRLQRVNNCFSYMGHHGAFIRSVFVSHKSQWSALSGTSVHSFSLLTDTSWFRSSSVNSRGARGYFTNCPGPLSTPLHSLLFGSRVKPLTEDKQKPGETEQAQKAVTW